MQGSRHYAGATPSWIIWQLLTRYTREGDLVIDPMCGSGTTIDVCRDLKRRALGYDLAPSRPDILRADARTIPVEDAKADFVFIDPPYSTHVRYSDDARCIGRLDAGADESRRENDYFASMRRVIGEIARILRPGRHMGLYVSDSRVPGPAGPPVSDGVFIPIGFRLFAMLAERLEPVDIVAVVRHNAKLDRGNWRRAADEGGFLMRGFNYLFIMRAPVPPPRRR
jgi:DNA modification methylase